MMGHNVNKTDRFGESFKQTEDDSNNNYFIKLYKKYEKQLKIILPIIVALLAIIYFFFFFQKGIIFYDNFLKRSVNGNQILYNANISYGNIDIIVISDIENDFQITYNLPENEIKSYNLQFSNQEKNLSNLLITSASGETLFKGKYDSYDNNFLHDENNEVVYCQDNFINIIMNNENSFEDYEPDYRNMASIVQGEDIKIKGNFALMLFGLALLALTAFDMKFPLALFYLEHFMSVNNPEPSDYHIAVQRFMWGVYPIIAIILLILSLFVR